MTDDVIHSTQYYIKYINRTILANLQHRPLKLGRLIVLRGSNIGFVHPASHHFFLLHPAIPPNETFPSRSRLLVLVNMQLM